MTEQLKLQARALADCDPALVAAAPELLAALTEMAAHAEIGMINQPALLRAYDAIAKARGES